MYSLGIDLAEPTTSWARASGGSEVPDAEGAVPSAVRLGPNGALTVIDPDDSSAASEAIRGFVGFLGTSEPVMVGGTPYGVDALVACVLAEVVSVNAGSTGSAPDRVVLVHDDDLDPYRLSLLNESARVAGIGPDRLMLVTRSAATAAAGTAGGATAAGASLLGAQALPASPAGSAGTARGIAAGAGGVVAGGATGVVAAVGLGAEATAGGVASAAGAAAGPAGSSVGPAGSSVGPAGSSVGPAGASAAAGPGGSGALVAGQSAFPWIPVAIGGAIAVVVAVIVAVMVVAGGEDPPPEEAIAVVTTDAIVVDTSPAIEPASTAPVETDVATTQAVATSEPESSTTLNPDIDLSAFVGDWVTCSASTSGTNVSAAVEYQFAAAGPNQLLLDYQLLVYTDSLDCSTTGIPSTAASYTVDIVGETVIDGVPAVQAVFEGESVVMGVEGDTLRYATNPSGEGFPTAFDPTLAYSRRL